MKKNFRSIFGNQKIQRRLDDESDDDEEEGEQKSTGRTEKRKATDILAEVRALSLHLSVTCELCGTEPITLQNHFL